MTMAPRWTRFRCILFLALVVSAHAAFSTEIKLKTGSVYENAKILHQDARSIEIQVQFGVINIPIANVESIDGVSLSQPPVVTNVAPAVEAPVIEKPKPKEIKPPPYVHAWTMDVFLGVLGVVAGIWIAMLLWVQKDLDDRHTDSYTTAKRWNTIVLLVPVIGFLMYLFARGKELRAEDRAAAAAEKAAAGLDIAPPEEKR